MDDTLPVAILADLAGLGRALGEVIRANADGTLAALEAAVETALRDVAPRLPRDRSLPERAQGSRGKAYNALRVRSEPEFQRFPNVSSSHW